MLLSVITPLAINTLLSSKTWTHFHQNQPDQPSLPQSINGTWSLITLESWLPFYFIINLLLWFTSELLKQQRQCLLFEGNFLQFIKYLLQDVYLFPQPWGSVHSCMWQQVMSSFIYPPHIKTGAVRSWQQRIPSTLSFFKTQTAALSHCQFVTQRLNSDQSSSCDSHCCSFEPPSLWSLTSLAHHSALKLRRRVFSNTANK